VSESLRGTACRIGFLLRVRADSPASRSRPCSRLSDNCLTQKTGPGAGFAAASAKPVRAPISPKAVSQSSCTPCAPSPSGKAGCGCAGFCTRLNTPGKVVGEQAICSYYVLMTQSQYSPRNRVPGMLRAVKGHFSDAASNAVPAPDRAQARSPAVICARETGLAHRPDHRAGRWETPGVHGEAPQARKRLPEA